MKFSLISIVLLFSIDCLAQDFLWAHSNSQSSFTHVSTIRKDHNNDLYLSYLTDSVGNEYGNYIVKYDQSQNEIWNFHLEGTGRITDLEINSLNHAIVCGYYTNDFIIGTDTLHSSPDESAFLIELDESGNITWDLNLNPTSSGFRPVDLFIDQSDNLYIAGRLGGSGAQGFCSFHKLSPWGNVLQSEFNNNFEDRTFSHIFADVNGNVYLSGTCGNLATFDSLTVPNYSYQNFLIAYDSAFNAKWILNRPYITFDDNNGLGFDGQTLYWAFDESISNADTIRLTKVDLNGNYLLDQPGPLQGAFFPGVNLGVDNAGNSTVLVSVYARLYLFRFDSNYNMTYTDTIFTHTSGFPVEAPFACYDSSFYLASRYYLDSMRVGPLMIYNANGSSSGADVFFAKWGYSSTTGIPLTEENNVRVYPNPVLNKVRIDNLSGAVKITITDLNGRLIEEKKYSNKTEVDLDFTNLNASTYFIQVESGENNLYKIYKTRLNKICDLNGK